MVYGKVDRNLMLIAFLWYKKNYKIVIDKMDVSNTLDPIFHEFNLSWFRMAMYSNKTKLHFVFFSYVSAFWYQNSETYLDLNNYSK